VGVAVGHLEPLAESLQPDRVLELEEKPGDPGRVQVVVGERVAESSRDQTGIEAIGRVLDEDGAIGELLEGGGYLTQGGGPSEHGAVDPVDPPGVWIYVVSGVHQALQGDPRLGRAVVGPQLEADRPQFDHPVGEVAGRLTVEGDEAELGKLGVLRWPRGQLSLAYETTGEERQRVWVVERGRLG
jgi:hypothetical protein